MGTNISNQLIDSVSRSTNEIINSVVTEQINKTSIDTHTNQSIRVDLSDAVFIGDSMTDMRAGLAAGVRCMLVLTGLGVEQWVRLDLVIPAR